MIILLIIHIDQAVRSVGVWRSVLGVIVASVRSSIPCCVACSALLADERGRASAQSIGDVDDEPSPDAANLAARMGFMCGATW